MTVPSNVLKKLLVGGGMAGAGGGVGAYWASRPYHGDEGISNWELLKARKYINRVRRLSRDPKGYDILNKHQRHRIATPLDNINPEAFKHLGFIKSVVAVPEKGQTSNITYRSILPDNMHVHRHQRNWISHKDKHPALSVLKARGELGPDAIYEGLKHSVTEGIPGYFGFLKSTLRNSPTMSEILLNDELAKTVNESVLEKLNS